MKAALIQFFQDVNGQYCQRTLLAFIFAFFLLILCIIAVIYGLGHAIQSSSVVVEVIWGMITLVGGALGLSTFIRKVNNTGDKPSE